MLPNTNPSRTGRRFLKRFLYAQMTVMDAVTIALGRSQPKVPFTVKAEPSSVYFNFRVRPEQHDAFTRYCNLPDNFAITPIQCLQGEQSDILLTLNVYEVTGIARGIRAEWSTYIRDAQGVPRYMVLEAQSSEYSMDPVDVITRKGRVEHSTNAAQINTLVAALGGGLFEATVPLTNASACDSIDSEWVTANDYIYWRNGICDRTFYDTGLAYPAASLIPVNDAQISDNTHWAPFLEPVPKHVVQIRNAIDFVIMPWCNI